ncbi:hypothetical protein BC938DRAFT_480733 [Jimgerdemannia flammicorona]|uniref:Uncharacterized protein n=1 Tax=Jimgerdemannia flammicorona TaxID=994334 RepID=A0A433QXD9_9FUNG|nr:hypothetical protein BC938DRAFT_480733 [Jimgerdemannia flammicorona]
MATTLNDFAGHYESQGRCDEAEPLYLVIGGVSDLGGFMDEAPTTAGNIRDDDEMSHYSHHATISPPVAMTIRRALVIRLDKHATPQLNPEVRQIDTYRSIKVS